MAANSARTFRYSTYNLNLIYIDFVIAVSDLYVMMLSNSKHVYDIDPLGVLGLLRETQPSGAIVFQDERQRKLFCNAIVNSPEIRPIRNREKPVKTVAGISHQFTCLGYVS